MNEFHQHLITMRHAFHRDPELGFNEVRTKSLVAARLRDLGLEVLEGVGVIGVLRMGSSTRAIGLRADMDALPITETSVGRLCHGCSGRWRSGLWFPLRPCPWAQRHYRRGPVVWSSSWWGEGGP